jgi:hypothetical protein
MSAGQPFDANSTQRADFPWKTGQRPAKVRVFLSLLFSFFILILLLSFVIIIADSRHHLQAIPAQI